MMARFRLMLVVAVGGLVLASPGAGTAFAMTAGGAPVPTSSLSKLAPSRPSPQVVSAKHSRGAEASARIAGSIGPLALAAPGVPVVTSVVAEGLGLLVAWTPGLAFTVNWPWELAPP